MRKMIEINLLRDLGLIVLEFSGAASLIVVSIGIYKKLSRKSKLKIPKAEEQKKEERREKRETTEVKEEIPKSDTSKVVCPEHGEVIPILLHDGTLLCPYLHRLYPSEKKDEAKAEVNVDLKRDEDLYKDIETIREELTRLKQMAYAGTAVVEKKPIQETSSEEGETEEERPKKRRRKSEGE